MSTDSQLIDRIYMIISKEKEPDRYEALMQFMEQYPSLAAILEIVEPYWYGRDTDKIDLSRFSVMKESECMLFESHVNVLRTALAAPDVERFLVLESDCIFAPNFDKSLRAICEQWRDLDISNSIVFLGDGCGIRLKETYKQLSPNLFLADGTRCCDSILMTRRSAQLLYENSTNCAVNQPIDHYWNGPIRRGVVDALWIKPHIVVQGSATRKYKSHLRGA